MSRSGKKTAKNQRPLGSLEQAVNNGASCAELAATLKALSHPVRLKVLLLLACGPKSITELHAGCASCSQSQMSQFVSRMTLEGLVSSRRVGRGKIVEIADARVRRTIHALVKIYTV